jgi:hypothetical protein
MSVFIIQCKRKRIQMVNGLARNEERHLEHHDAWPARIEHVIERWWARKAWLKGELEG